jgi:hypothetical protein
VTGFGAKNEGRTKKGDIIVRNRKSLALSKEPSNAVPSGDTTCWARNIRKPILAVAVLLLPCLGLLACASLNSSDPEERQTAVNGLDDQVLLAKVALSDRAVAVREAAVQKLTNQVLIEKVALYSAKTSVNDWSAAEASARSAANKLTDPTAIGNVALHAASAIARRIAAQKLTDQAVIEKVALGDKEYDVRQIAVGKLNSQDALEKVALNDREHRDVRLTAVDRLTDQAALERVVLNEKYSVLDPSAQLAAVAKLDSPDALKRVGLKCEKDSKRICNAVAQRFGQFLQRASRDGEIDLVGRLLDAGANVNAATEDGTALTFAAGQGRVAVVKLLLSKGANPNIRKLEDKIGMSFAMGVGMAPTTSYVTIPGKPVPAPLGAAAENGHVEVVKLLLSNRAVVDASDIARAEKSGHTEIATLLRQAKK